MHISWGILYVEYVLRNFSIINGFRFSIYQHYQGLLLSHCDDRILVSIKWWCSLHITMTSRWARWRPCVNKVTMQFTHYNDVTMGTMASQITSLAIVCSTVYSGADQRKHQSPASLAFVWGIHRGPVNSPHKGPVTRKMFPFDDVITRYNQRSRHFGHGWTWPSFTPKRITPHMCCVHNTLMILS